jgi:hypothetical protein
MEGQPDNSRPDIFCWKHDCDTATVQFSHFKSDKCLLCFKSVSPLPNLISLPYPYDEVTQVECDLVVATAFDQPEPAFKGMHIGICDGHGKVLEFDKAGLLFDDSLRRDLVWRRCIRLNFLDQIGLGANKNIDEIRTMWQRVVTSIRTTQTLAPYDNESNNCLNFIQMFLCEFMQVAKMDGHLSSQQVDELLKYTSTKVELCRHFVLSKTKQLARYMALERKLKAGVNVLQL